MDKNEAIKIIRSNFPTGRKILCEALEILIPELKENEDERIRKDLIRYLNTDMNENPSQSNSFYKKCITWLEKQGEQKPSAWSEEDEEMLDSIIANMQFTQKAHPLEVNQVVYERDIDWLKYLKQRMKGE